MQLDINKALLFMYRIENLACKICEINPEHDHETPIVQARLDDEDNPVEVELTLTTKEMVNESCSCHPEYYLKEVTTEHSLPIDELLNGDYFDEFGYVDRSTHPYLIRYAKFLEEEKQRKQAEKEAMQRAEEKRSRVAREQKERQELARLQSKYKG
jgi:hypothetical protein